jgi:polyphosphate kinase 2 (PPK2 family)
MNAFERYLTRNGYAIRKVFLHISKEEQRERLLARLDEPDKQWKFQEGDIAERARWNDYMAAYEDSIRATSTPYAPWYVVPGNHKWFARLAIAQILIDAMRGLDLRLPAVDAKRKRVLAAIRRNLS